MSTAKVDNFAFQHNISNSEAKRRMKGGRRERQDNLAPSRGVPVAGTGKKKGE